MARAHQAAFDQKSPFGSMFVFPVCNGWKSAQHPHSIRIAFWAVFGAAPQAPNLASESCLFFFPGAGSVRFLLLPGASSSPQCRRLVDLEIGINDAASICFESEVRINR